MVICVIASLVSISEKAKLSVVKTMAVFSSVVTAASLVSGASLTPVTVMFKLAVFVAVPSETV